MQSSCGMSIPYFDYVGERELFNDWAEQKGEEGIRKYWAEKNKVSIDNQPTNIIQKSL